MNRSGFRPRLVWSAIILAFVLWFVTFYLEGLNFWIKIAFSATTLAALSARVNTLRANKLLFDRLAVFQGIIAAVVLYLVFWAGKIVSSCIFPFASQQVSAIYGKGAGFSSLTIFFILLFLTGPCEEIFWRGFLQRNLMSRYGEYPGWLLATMIYTGVHIWSFNFMLIGAAAVAGSFWGLLYMKLKRLDSIIICHSLWSAFIFAVVPLRISS
ncbi:MAG TPA: type II CAAX endopeptidase family protein [Desulfomonilia bacterium]|nr:type II CAAX endopeptidase family protein [Desulfomonilia bacterium]